MSNAETQRVHIQDAHGSRVYSRLLDDGGEILRFESGNGFLTRRQIISCGWTIHAGWPAE